MSSATLDAAVAAPAEKPKFEMPFAYKGMSVLYTPNHSSGGWFPALVSRVASDSLELIVWLTDGIVGRDEGSSAVTYSIKDVVRHVDDPYAKSEVYETHVLGDGDGGLWKYDEGTERLFKLEQELIDLRMMLQAPKPKSKPSEN